MRSTLRVAIVQDEVAPDLERGLALTDSRAADAAGAGASLAVFPETWLPGYPAWLDVCRDAGLWDHAPVKAVFRRMANDSIVVDGASGRALGAIAARHGIALVVGVTERVEHGPARGTLFNALLTFGPDGSLLNHHRKLVPTYTERLVWGQGDGNGVRAVDVPTATGSVRVGGLVCWEHWMPLARQALHESGEDVHIAAWPTVKEMLQVASRHYAFEGRCYVLAAGSLLRASALPPELEAHPAIVTSEQQFVLRGGSAIIAPNGRYVCDPVFDAPALLVADLDPGLTREESMTLDVTGHYSRPDVFAFEVNPHRRCPDCEPSLRGTCPRVRPPSFPAPMDTLISDVRFALRSLLRSPSFAVTAVLALGLGIGSTAGVFSLLEGVVLRPLPYRDPARLVTIWDSNREKGLKHEAISPVTFHDYRALSAVFADAAAWWRPQLNLADETGDPIRISAVETTENLFDVLGVQPAMGRGFTVHPGLFGPEHEAIISNRLWQTRFGGDPKIIGRPIRLNGFTYTVVGIMPAGFGFPGDTDLWQQLQWDLHHHSRGAHFMESVARLAPGVTVDRANRELAALGLRLGNEFRGTNAGWTPKVIELDRETAGVFRPGLFALFGASALLLTLACINVANLLLARASGRRREVAVRSAIGASRGRLVRLFLTESVLLAAAGAALGLVVAVLSVKALMAASPVRIPRADAVGIDAPVLVFATLVAALTALAFGLVPAFILSRSELQDALKDGGKGSGAQGRALRSALVVVEVALAVILLSGAGLLVRSVTRMLAVNTGVDPAFTITADMQLPDAAYREWPRVQQFYASLVRALEQRPGIVAAGTTTFLPLEPGWRIAYLPVGAGPVPAGEEPMAQFHSADAGYFAALRVPIVRGRTFDAHDDVASTPVVIVNETLARRLWPNEDPVGKRIRTTIRNIGPIASRNVPGDEHQVVGVVRDIRNTSLRDEPEPAMYFATGQFPARKMHLVVRGRGDPAQLTAIIREEVRHLDPTLPLGDVKPMSRVLESVVDPPRFVMMLMIAFAVLALALAAVGIYGMLSYAVSHRRREFGIRLALGARPAGVVRLILREGLTLALAGCATGIAGMFVAGRSLSGFLFEIKPWDATTLGTVLAVVVVVASLACLIPGRRAAAEDPAGTLRAD